jgi:transposase, IS30 family
MSHLTESQRYTISTMLENGYKQTEIAKTIGKCKSVVCREKSRSSDKRNSLYKHDLANRKYRHRQKYKRKKHFFTESVKSYVESSLEQKFSPEQIAGIAKKEGVKCVSAERIYQHIWRDKKLGGKLFEELRTQGKRYRKRGAEKDKRGIIIGRRDISERPQVVEIKERIGDLEIDTIIGKNHQGAIVTINDRASGMLKMKKLESKNAEQLAIETIKLLSEWQPILHTITSDNGKEFAAHKTISDALGIDFFFAEPYHSWQRGSNENLNGLIRQYIPKQTDFSTITDEYVVYVENELNNRPRKRHNFETPNYVFNKLIRQEKVAFMT